MKPAKTTWVIFFVIVLFLIANIFTLNIFDIGVESLVVIPFYLPFVMFEYLGLDLGSGGGAGWGWPSPNSLGYVLIILSNLVVIYLVSLLISKLFKRNKNSSQNSFSQM